MKKIFAALGALALVASVTYAQTAGINPGTGITIHSSGKGLIIPVIGNKDGLGATLQQSSGGNPRVGITVSGDAGFGGFLADIYTDGGVIAIGDQAKLWVQPLSWLKLQVGLIYDDTLQGNASFGAYKWQRYGNMSGDDAIFVQVGGTDDAPMSAVLSLTPIQGLFAFIDMRAPASTLPKVPSLNPGDTSWTSSFRSSNKNIETGKDVLSSLQYGIGYEIPTVGLIRAQYVGQAWDPEEGNRSYVNAAFKLTAVEGLLIDAGAFIPINSLDAGYVVRAALYAKVDVSILTIHGLGVVQFNKEAVNDNMLGVEIGGGIDIALQDQWTINADVRWLNAGANSLGTYNVQRAVPDPTNPAQTISQWVPVSFGEPVSVINAMVGISKAFGDNALIGLGFEFSTNSNFQGSLPGSTSANGQVDKLLQSFSIPIRVEYKL